MTMTQTSKVYQVIRWSGETMQPAIDPAKWLSCLDPATLGAVRARVALCLDVAPDELHATVAAAAVLDDGRVRVEIVHAWSGVGNDSFGDFRIIKANHAPEFNAIGVMATDGVHGYLFFGFLPYGSTLWI